MLTESLDGADRRERLRSQRRHGFTLVELLIAMLLFSVVMTGLLSLTRSTLRLTGTSVAVSSSITDVSKAEGYVSDLFRVSKAVLGSADVVLPSGDTVSCRLEGDSIAVPPVEAGRCIALLVPVVEPTGAQRIVDFDLVVLSVEPILDRFVAEGIPRGYAGPDTLALFEYRAVGLCSDPTAPIVPCVPNALGLDDPLSSTDIDSTGLIVLGISPVNAANAAVQTFRLAGDDASSRTLLLSFVVRADGPTGSPFAVRESAVALEVGVRGLAPVAGEN